MINAAEMKWDNKPDVEAKELRYPGEKRGAA